MAARLVKIAAFLAAFHLSSFTNATDEPKKITYPVFPNVSFLFHDSYDPFHWRLTKPDFLQLPKSQDHPNVTQPVVMFYMRRTAEDSPSDTPPSLATPTFYSTNCTHCQVWASYSFTGGMTWEEPFVFLGLTTEPVMGWWARSGPRVCLQQVDGVSALHFAIGKTTSDHLALLHFSTNGSLPEDGRSVARDIFAAPEVVRSTDDASIAHTPIVVNNGKRILFPTHYAARPNKAPPFGIGNVTVYYSDDFGVTWLQASPELVVLSPNGGDGANEPAVIELLNGTIWMLIRDSVPVLYESYSTDFGATWSTPQSTRFASYSSPAHLIRLKAKKPGILLVWNNGLIGENGKYGRARQVIHGAVSYDEGDTWHGFRELYRDPHMGEEYLYGDHGSAYPTGKEMDNGNVVISTGQGAYRQTVFVFNPDWLLETEQYTMLNDVKVFNDTSNYFGNYFTAVGVSFIIDPTNTSCSRDLRVIRFDARAGKNSVAEYNFPGFKRGRLIFTVYPVSENFSAAVKLMDFFAPPSNPVSDKLATFAFDISTVCNGSERDSQSSSSCVVVGAKTWHMIELDWDVNSEVCRVIVDVDPDSQVKLPLISRTFAMQPSYLRVKASSGLMYLRAVDAKAAS
eukprot:m.309190 g.309190  ORF g.309190 m.309190 type:complete len:624 (+) comp45750_c0_seq1:28-1899(+)